MGKIKQSMAAVLLLAAFALATGCGSRGARNTVTELMNAEIVFPENLRGKIMARDTTPLEWPEVPYKLVAYVNSTQCDDCRLKDLLVWKYYMRRVDSMGVADSLRFVFIFHPKDTSALTEKLTLYDFDRPVWLDVKGDFERLNPLPDDPAFQTFLVGPDNRVILIGTPIGRPKMWKLYEETVERLAAGEHLAAEGKLPIR